ncbi:MAG: amidohydrolase family protein [Planctomycetota bacterium]
MRATAPPLGLIAAVLASHAAAQPTGQTPLDPPQNGPRITEPGFHKLAGATVHLAPGAVLENATLIVSDGRVRAIRDADGVTVNQFGGSIQRIAIDVADRDASLRLFGEGAREWDYSGTHIYAGFVEPWIAVDVPAPHDTDPGKHWSPHITPQRRALDGGGLSADHQKTLRSLGYTAAALVPSMSKERSGLMGGLGAVVSLADPSGNPSASAPGVYRRDAFHAMDFNTDGWGGDLVYPTSQMGAIALIRQTLLDAGWLARQRVRPEHNALSTLTDLPDRPVFFDTDHELELFQAEAIFREFEGQPLSSLTLVGSGTEFRRLDALSRCSEKGSLSLILPLRTPREPDVSTVAKADAVDLKDLMTWEHAPANPRYVADAGIAFALTSSKLRERSEFHDHLHAAIEHGLSPQDALAALTTRPADLLGLADTLGSIALGRPANLVVATGDLFDPDADAEIRDLWIDGRRHEINPADHDRFDGPWTFIVGDEADPFFTMDFDVVDADGDRRVAIDHTPELDNGEPGEPIEVDGRMVQIGEASISFLIDDVDTNLGSYTVSGVLATDDLIVGTGVAPDETTFQWIARRRDPSDATSQPETTNAETSGEADTLPDLPGYPFGPYARSAIPERQHLVLRGATVWTATDDGIIPNGEVELLDGRIAYVGRSRVATPEGATVVPLDGKHLTPGLLDAHSHTGTWTFGTNEAGQAVTSEVRMGDTNDPDHINWYRQLAAGVTTVNTLHGSANAIGGQNVIQKVRWGVPHPRDTHLIGATPGIKFALGENVRQVNWGDDYRSRYPQSRMGVDAIMRDRFTAAVEYRAAKDAGNDPRPDLELEALAEIASNQRLIHCHSYRQDEILMLAEVARDFGFQIGSYQHALECYKVAEHVHEVSRGSSMFSDWWAYKIEVQDAIPYAGPIEWATGGRVSFNSDSDELVRRMNTEAAKAVKYAKQIGLNLTEHEALKFVTINPAEQLGVADRVGSLEVGKDADVAVWSRNPLSTLAVCEHTFIDGRHYFSLEQDRLDRERVAAERARIIQKILADDSAQDDEGAADEQQAAPETVDTPPTSLRERIALERWKNHLMSEHLEGKIGPTSPAQPGDCGCNLAQLGLYR